MEITVLTTDFRPFFAPYFGPLFLEVVKSGRCGSGKCSGVLKRVKKGVPKTLYFDPFFGAFSPLNS